MRAAPGADRDSRASRRRFLAPSRDEIAHERFDAPIFAGYAAHRDWMHGATWPTVAMLDERLGAIVHPQADVELHFAEQSPTLLDDGLHYERRILERGLIATRAANWHDLFNAMVWIEHPALKAALNLRQVRDLEFAGASQRTRAQCALTHFDEAGAIVLLRDAALLAAWDAHDWTRFFFDAREAWADGRVGLVVFGHALLEHALSDQLLATAKCLAVLAPPESALQPSERRLDARVSFDATAAIDLVAADIARGRLLQDPQQLRPLPLAGVPGWDARNASSAFHREAECFRPLREGRVYPPPTRP